MEPLELLPYIKISRSLFSNFLWKENRPFTRFEAWLDLIQRACFLQEDEQLINARLIKKRKGQVVASVRYLMERWKWSKGRVCGFLELLRSQEMISIDGANGISVITLINYDKHSGSMFRFANEDDENGTVRRRKPVHLNGHKSHSYEGEEDTDRTPADTATGQTEDSDRTNRIKYNKLNEGKKGNRISASLEAAYALTQQMKKEYDELVNGLKDNTPNECWEVIKGFVSGHRPPFVEPYMDLWNIFATHYKLIKKPVSITPNRKKKFETRIGEPGFDFIKILDCVKKSRFLKGDNERQWKVDFEFIVNSEENYTKILDEKYD